MKNAQRITYLFALLTCLFPPWVYTFDQNGSYGGHSKSPGGYHFIAAPPRPNSDNQYSGVQIDFPRLFIGWSALALMIFGVRFLPKSIPSRWGEKFKTKIESVPVFFAVGIVGVFGAIVLFYCFFNRH